MRILCIGDVVGSIGCRFLRDKLPTLKKVKGIDFATEKTRQTATELHRHLQIIFSTAV